MAIEVQTSNTSLWVKRFVTTPDLDGPYTVMFRIYLPADNPVSTVPWCMSDNVSTNGGLHVGEGSDVLRFKGDNDFNAECFDGTLFINPLISSAFLTGWHSMAIIAASQTSRRIYTDIGGNTATNGSFAARGATYLEGLFSKGDSGQSAAVGTRITNYKMWNVALTDGELDAEFLTTTVTKTSGFVSQSPMSDESVLANNLTASDGHTAWTHVAGCIAGANDPSVTYGGAANALVQVERGRAVGRGLGRGIF